jgi:hypothetical protein
MSNISNNYLVLIGLLVLFILSCLVPVHRVAQLATVYDHWSRWCKWSGFDAVILFFLWRWRMMKRLSSNLQVPLASTATGLLILSVDRFFPSTDSAAGSRFYIFSIILRNFICWCWTCPIQKTCWIALGRPLTTRYGEEASHGLIRGQTCSCVAWLIEHDNTSGSEDLILLLLLTLRWTRAHVKLYWLLASGQFVPVHAGTCEGQSVCGYLSVRQEVLRLTTRHLCIYVCFRDGVRVIVAAMATIRKCICSYESNFYSLTMHKARKGCH